MRTLSFRNSVFIALMVASFGAAAIEGADAETNRKVIAPINKPAFPVLYLPQDEAAGQRAIEILGNNLPAVAAWYRRSPDEFRSLLLNDKTTRIDGRGRLFYVEEAPAQAPLPSAPQGLIDGATLPLDQTFKLHSKPGSSKTIYLDFDGAVLTNTAWGPNTTLNAPAYSTDADPAFGTTDLTNIQAIWRQVAEDYAPFDVDVTTEAPIQSALTRADSLDNVYGTTALITTRAIYSCSCGGVAYVGVFDSVGDYYKPALVFYDALGGPKNIAEATSHEVGHNAGLSHDGTSTTGYYRGQGTGATGWAPIMGVGYYQALTQFSKGEYTDANNKEDDFVVAQTNGLSIRPLSEDVGDTIGTATLLTGTSTATAGILKATADGVIETAADKDVFGFTSGAGSVSITLDPVKTSPNLDANIQLISATGQIIAQSNPVDTLNASIATTLAAGTYYVLIDGVGKGSPLVDGYSNYGSVGWYRVSATYPTPDPNAPIASFTASTLSGTAPLTVNFDGTSSSDPNGDTLTYSWSFGDGSTILSSQPTTGNVFQNVGTYNVTLVVTDTTSRSSSATKTVVVNPAVVLPKAYVSNITLSQKVQKTGAWNVTAAITILDSNNRPVSGATVTGDWGGIVKQTMSVVTNSSGVATTTSPLAKTKGTISYTVTNVTANGYTYDSSLNLSTSKSLTR